MTVFIKKVKKELESGKKLVGTHIPPSYIYRSTSNYPILPTSRLEIVPRPGLKALTFKAVVKSEYPNRKTKDPDTKPAYKVTVQFHGLKFTETMDDYYNTKALQLDGKPVFYHIPNFAKNPVAVKCECPDMRHRFETQLSKVGGIIGQPRKYTRITPKWTLATYNAWLEDPINNERPYPYANATDKLGYCKHVHSMMKYLKENKLAKEV